MSPELFNKWKQMLIDDEHLSETDRKLKNIILNKSMNETDKWYNYRQVLLQNPHKFRYWQNDNVQKSIATQSENRPQRSTGTQSDSQENKRSVGTQSDNILIEHRPKFDLEIRNTERKHSNSDILETKPFKVNQNQEILPKMVKPQVMLEEIPSNIKIIKRKTDLEKKANAVITESILRKKAYAQTERGGKLQLKKLKKTADNKVIGARYFDDVHNQTISVDLSTDDELQGEIENLDDRPLRSKTQTGKGITSRITKLKRHKNKIPWSLYREKV